MYRRQQPNYSFPGTSQAPAAEPTPQYSFPSSSSFSVTSYTPSYGNFSCKLQGSFPFSSSSAATGYNPSNLSFPRAASTRSEKLNAVDIGELMFGATSRGLELGIGAATTGFVGKFIPGIGVVLTVCGMETTAARYDYENPSLSEDYVRIMNHPLLRQEIKEEMEDKLFPLKKPVVVEQPEVKTMRQFIKEDPRQAGYAVVDGISSAYSLFSMGSTAYRSLRPSMSSSPAKQPAAIEGHSTLPPVNQRGTVPEPKAVFNPELHSSHLNSLNKTFSKMAEDAASRDFGEVPKKWVPGFRNFSERSGRQGIQFRLNDQNGKKSVPPFSKPPT